MNGGGEESHPIGVFLCYSHAVLISQIIVTEVHGLNSSAVPANTNITRNCQLRNLPCSQQLRDRDLIIFCVFSIFAIAMEDHGTESAYTINGHIVGMLDRDLRTAKMPHCIYCSNSISTKRTKPNLWRYPVFSLGNIFHHLHRTTTRRLSRSRKNFYTSLQSKSLFTHTHSLTNLCDRYLYR